MCGCARMAVRGLVYCEGLWEESGACTGQAQADMELCLCKQDGERAREQAATVSAVMRTACGEWRQPLWRTCTDSGRGAMHGRITQWIA